MALQRQMQQRKKRLQDISAHKAIHLQFETLEKWRDRLQKLSESQAARLHSETPEQRLERLQDMSERHSISLELETEQERQERLIKELQSKKRLVLHCICSLFPHQILTWTRSSLAILLLE